MYYQCCRTNLLNFILNILSQTHSSYSSSYVLLVLDPLLLYMVWNIMDLHGYFLVVFLMHVDNSMVAIVMEFYAYNYYWYY